MILSKNIHTMVVVISTVLAMRSGGCPRYMKTGKCNANSASASINKWLKRDFDGLTAHCLRHTMRDRLRAAECPVDMIDQIGGWRSVATIGVRYGKGYELNKVRKVINKICI